ncbi:pyruvate/2-oxoglutarate dehydrogenase complex [Rhodobacter sp. NSM]|uniref:pyruvate/2-oxoglutarate dehydrogenase complex n=1 Tax=Rhodobacter sp. NSM TaxID=3457501 RepID=UPI003FD32491
MRRTHPAAAALAALFLSGCAEMAARTVPAEAELTRLQALGFTTAATSRSGLQVLRYSGPVTAAVACRSAAGSSYDTPPTARVRGDGARQRIELDAYLMLNPGADGQLAPGERDGIYVVTIVTLAGGRASTESVSFGPGGSGTFRSGMTCRPT